MNSFDIAPFNRNHSMFDRLGNLLQDTVVHDQLTAWPAYNLEAVDENEFIITLVVAGYQKDDLDIKVEANTLTISAKESGQKSPKDAMTTLLHHGIMTNGFKQQFKLAEYVEVESAAIEDGLLRIRLVQKIPEAMKPKSIAIQSPDKTVLAHHGEKEKAA